MWVKQLKKKLVGGHKKQIYLTIIFILFFNNPVISSQILDYETESFINKIILEIKNINKINREIRFKIISNNNINAYVDENNVIHITSGLIENCEDYVALISVLAHEIGHVDLNHIASRKTKIKNINKFRNISNLSVIAGSMISSNPELLKSIAINSAGSSEIFIKFSKEQELQADLYSIETLKKLNLHSVSIINLLNVIKKHSEEKGSTKSTQRVSTHPYFEDRIDLINYLREYDSYQFNDKTNVQFQFIRSKFLGYSENNTIIEALKKPFVNYSLAITKAMQGDLESALKKINPIIKLYPNNIFLIETKADILFSYGFTKESIKFYELVLKKEPNNIYAQMRIFTNTKIENLSKNEVENLFNNNLELLYRYYNNKNLLKKFLELSQKNNMEEWEKFISFLNNIHLSNTENLERNLNIYKSSNNKDLSHLANIIYNNY